MKFKTGPSNLLTHHARAYRELSTLPRRPPGREPFPDMDEIQDEPDFKAAP